jgi:hypothetical protein
MCNDSIIHRCIAFRTELITPGAYPSLLPLPLFNPAATGPKIVFPLFALQAFLEPLPSMFPRSSRYFHY